LAPEKLQKIVSTEDKMIPPDAQRAMSKRAGSKETKGRRAVYVSHPDAVASLIEGAALGFSVNEK